MADENSNFPLTTEHHWGFPHFQLPSQWTPLLFVWISGCTVVLVFSSPHQVWYQKHLFCQESSITCGKNVTCFIDNLSLVEFILIALSLVSSSESFFPLYTEQKCLKINRWIKVQLEIDRLSLKARKIPLLMAIRNQLIAEDLWLQEVIGPSILLQSPGKLWSESP